jgi:hypothetical protein
MDQINSEPYDDPIHGSITLMTNDLPIDLTCATIHRYIIKFSPQNILLPRDNITFTMENTLPTKEKKFLARRLVAQLRLSNKYEGFIYDNDFEILLPNAADELLHNSLQAVYFRKKVPVGQDKSTTSETSSDRTKVCSEYLTDRLISHPKGKTPTESDFPSDGQGGLQIFTVYAAEAPLNLGSFQSNLKHSQVSKSVGQERQDVLRAIDKIMLREAHHTSSVQVNSSKIFDMAGVPARKSHGIEFRRGLSAETCIVNGSLVRRLTPCTGFFLDSSSKNLGSLLRRLYPIPEGSEPAPLDAGEVVRLLKGVRIQKSYGKRGFIKMIGLTAGNPDQETFYWNNNKTTTVSHYMEKGRKRSAANLNISR